MSDMSPLDLALKYMEAIFSGRNIEELAQLLSENFNFSGPLYKFDSAEEYIKSLKADPPEGFKYKLIKSFQNESSACLIYEFSKPGICVPMAQLFEIKNSKICNVLLIFDTEQFTH